MAVLDDLLKGSDLTTGLVVGAGALILWPLLKSVARPAAKSVIKGGLIAYKGAGQLYSTAVEGVRDIAQEAQQEIGATRPGAGALASD